MDLLCLGSPLGSGEPGGIALKKPKRFTDPGSAARAEPPLDRAQVAQAALDLLDEVGLEGLTMRRLAERLGIKAASLYWHVRDKNDLLDMLAEAICADIPSPDAALPWRARLEGLSHAYRHVLLSHRDAASVLVNTGAPTGPNRLRLMEGVLHTLLEAGFSRRDAAYTAYLLNDYVTLFVTEEVRFAEAAQAGGDAGQRWLQDLPPDEYAHVLAVADHLIDGRADDRFAFGLGVLLDGLSARLAQTRG